MYLCLAVCAKALRLRSWTRDGNIQKESKYYWSILSQQCTIAYFPLDSLLMVYCVLACSVAGCWVCWITNDGNDTSHVECMNEKLLEESSGWTVSDIYKRI